MVGIPEPDTHHGSAARHDVEGRDLLGDVDGIVQRKQQDAGGKSKRGRDAGEIRQIGNRLVVAQLRSEEVLPGTDEIEAEPFHQVHQLLVLGHLLGWRSVGRVHRRQLQAEAKRRGRAHGAPSRPANSDRPSSARTSSVCWPSRGGPATGPGCAPTWSASVTRTGLPGTRAG
jgi:hypothetical protein